MRLLIDTHLLLLAANDALPNEAVPYFSGDDNELFFSSASIWEVVIKRELGRSDFLINPNDLYCGLVNNGYNELSVTSHHTLITAHLPPYHNDPFDRILIAQAMAEGLTLISSDEAVSRYSPVIFINS